MAQTDLFRPNDFDSYPRFIFSIAGIDWLYELQYSSYLRNLQEDPEVDI
jgi:hypothetical protein